MTLRVVATIEARMTSSRLPGKVLLPAGGKPLLQILIERLRRASRLDAIVLATTINSADDPVCELGHRLGIDVFRGSEHDVLGRVCGALRSVSADVCVEITGDCPLIDPDLVEETIAAFIESKDRHPYVSNSDPHRAVPAGFDVQVFLAEALYALERETDDPQDREHVSYGFYRPEGIGRWNPRFVKHTSCAGGEGLLATLDFEEDYRLIRRIHEELSLEDSNYSVSRVIGWIKRNSEIHDACLKVRNMQLQG